MKAFWQVFEGGVSLGVVGGLDMITDIGVTWKPCICSGPSNLFFSGSLLASYAVGMFISTAMARRRRSIFRKRDGSIFRSKDGSKIFDEEYGEHLLAYKGNFYCYKSNLQWTRDAFLIKPSI